MHRAPAVSYRVVRSVPHLALIGLLWATAIFALWFLGATQPLSFKEILAACIATMLCGGVAVWGWQRSSVGLLRWDGGLWHWDRFAEESACDLVLQMDLQALLLVTVARPDGQRAWLWLARNAAGAQWRALRRAVAA